MSNAEQWRRFLDALEAHLDGKGTRDVADAAIPGTAEALAELLGLDALELTLLVTACAPAMRPRIREQLAVGRSSKSTAGVDAMTCISLTGADHLDSDARHPLREDAPLRSLGLVRLEPKDAPLASQFITVPDRVVGALLGDSWPDPAVMRAVVIPVRPALAPEMLPSLPAIERATVVLRAAAGTAAVDQARRISLDTFDTEPLIVDAGRIEMGAGGVDGLVACITEAALRQAPLAVDARSLDSEAAADIARRLSRLVLPTIIMTSSTVRMASPEDIHIIELPAPSVGQRAMWWEQFASGTVTDVAKEATHLDPEDIAALDDSSVTEVMIRRFSAQARDSKIRAIAPEFTLADVVVDSATEEALRHLCDRVRYRTLVLDEWGMRPGGAKGRGVSALFTGPPGTGKTLAAEALAGELDLPLFCVELASVVDKYIGETEKNLERVFAAVERVDGILLFDEADALFGKRSDVSDSRDRYANIEVAYLLQRIEAFDGLAILTTNLRANLDDAFQRRLDMIVDFPEPDRRARKEMWSRALGEFPDALSEDDLEALAVIDLTGGYIRAAAINAAYFAAAEGVKVNRRHVLLGVRTEWRKCGRINFPDATFTNW